MKKRFNLLENEFINFEIKKKRSFPFLVSDLLYVGMIFIFIVIFQTINLKNITEISSETIFKLITVLFFIFFMIMCLNQFCNRYINVFKLKIILTNFRLIVVDKKEQLIKEFYLNRFPKLSYSENAYTDGTLIIRETKKVKEFPYRGYESHSFDLYGIKNVKEIYLIIQSKINDKNN